MWRRVLALEVVFLPAMPVHLSCVDIATIFSGAGSTKLRHIPASPPSMPAGLHQTCPGSLSRPLSDVSAPRGAYHRRPADVLQEVKTLLFGNRYDADDVKQMPTDHRVQAPLAE